VEALVSHEMTLAMRKLRRGFEEPRQGVSSLGVPSGQGVCRRENGTSVCRQLVWKRGRLQQSGGRVEVDALTTCKIFDEFLKSAAELSHKFYLRPPSQQPSSFAFWWLPNSGYLSHFIRAEPSGCTWSCLGVHPAVEVAANAPATLHSFLRQHSSLTSISPASSPRMSMRHAFPRPTT